jgi:hypothetical protein
MLTYGHTDRMSAIKYHFNKDARRGYDERTTGYFVILETEISYGNWGHAVQGTIGVILASGRWTCYVI